MDFKCLVLLCTCLTLQSVYCSANTYKGYKVYSVTPRSSDEVHHLKSLVDNIDKKVYLWSDDLLPRHPVLLHAAPDVQDKLQNELKSHDISFEVTIQDLEDAIEKQKEKPTVKSQNPSVISDFALDEYHTLEEIETWMHSLANDYKDIVTLLTVATSYEGRNITALKISSDRDVTNKPVIWIDGGIHAREWVSPATMVYFVNYFLTEFNKNTTVTDLLKTFDFYILPVFNVDGYDYTWKLTGDRMWRKTRSKHVEGTNCVGADPNRNWDIFWGTVGVSKNPCSDSFGGAFAFSEQEVEQVADFIQKLKPIAYFSHHSYSQYFMLPYGYTYKAAPDYAELMNVCQAANVYVYKVDQKLYLCGSLADLVGMNSGSSVDYTYGELNIKYSFGVELRDKGKYGFLLPADQIIPTAQEQIPFLVYVAEYIKQNELM